MAEFNVGDKVRLTARLASMPAGTTGVVTVSDVADTRFPYMIDFDYKDGDKWPVESTEIEAVPNVTPKDTLKFTKGDRAMVTSKRYLTLTPGTIVTVAHVGRYCNGETQVSVNSDGYPEGLSFPYPPSELELLAGHPVYPNSREVRALQPVNQTILSHLEYRSISPSEAMVTYGIARLAAAIHDLRAAGYDIITQLKTDALGHRYARYSMNEVK